MQMQPTVSQRIRDRLYLLIVHRDTDFVEVASGLMMLGWGIQLLMPWDTFRTGIGYSALAMIAPEPAWGGLLAWCGFTQVGSYLLQHRRVRKASSLGAVMIWTFLSVAFGYGNPHGTAIVVYPFLATLSALVYWRNRISGGA